MELKRGLAACATWAAWIKEHFKEQLGSFFAFFRKFLGCVLFLEKTKPAIYPCLKLNYSWLRVSSFILIIFSDTCIFPKVNSYKIKSQDTGETKAPGFPPPFVVWLLSISKLLFSGVRIFDVCACFLTFDKHSLPSSKEILESDDALLKIMIKANWQDYS